jgi:hypothetical protein
VSRPNTFVELSKGTNDVRQRRVRFSSEEGVVGLDLAYDEVLDDGYAFDAATVADEPDSARPLARRRVVLRGTRRRRELFVRAAPLSRQPRGSASP